MEKEPSGIHDTQPHHSGINLQSLGDGGCPTDSRIDTISGTTGHVVRAHAHHGQKLKTGHGQSSSGSGGFPWFLNLLL